MFLFLTVLFNAPVCKKTKTQLENEKQITLFSYLSFLKNVLCTRSDMQTSWKEEVCVWILSIYKTTLQKREKLTFIWINKSNMWPKHKLLFFIQNVCLRVPLSLLYGNPEFSCVFRVSFCVYTFKMAGGKIKSQTFSLTPRSLPMRLLGLNNGSKKSPANFY